MRKILPLFLLAAILLASCQSSPTLPNPSWPTPTPVSGQLRPFFTPTVTPQPSGSAPRPSPVFTHTPLPSPTPFIYVVKRNDTMLGIALFYGIELAALKAANPTVDPLVMSVGTQLIIPLPGNEGPEEPTPTPIFLTLDQPACFSLNDGSLWCSLMLHNNFDLSVENISVRLDLVSADGNLAASQVLFPLLNHLPGGTSSALFARFDGLAGIPLEPYAGLLTAAPVNAESERYPAVEITLDTVEISSGGLKASYTGQAQVLGPAQTLWIVASVFDAQGRPVGMRKQILEISCTAEMLAAEEGCPVVSFEGELYSVGPQVVHFGVLAEAHP